MIVVKSTTSRPFLDTNVLVYAVLQDDPRAVVAAGLLRDGGVVSVQVLNEFADVARRKFRWQWARIGEALDLIGRLDLLVMPLTAEAQKAAVSLAARLDLRIYGASILASALHAGCQEVLTEDLQDGQVIDGGLKIRNPFLR